MAYNIKGDLQVARDLQVSRSLEVQATAKFSRVLVSANGSFYYLPTSAGASGQSLVTDGNGQLYWSEVSNAPEGIIWRSSAISFTNGQQFGGTHGIGKNPDLINFELVNLSAESGYIPGDRVQINYVVAGGIGWGEDSYGIAVRYDSTTVSAIIGLDGILLNNFSTGIIEVIDSSNWTIQAIVTKFGAGTTASAVEYFAGQGLSLIANTFSVDNTIVTTTTDQTITGTKTFAGTQVFNNISAVGVITASLFHAPAGDTAAAPSFSWDIDSDTGIYRPFGNTIAISTDGTERLLITNNTLRHSGTDPRIQLVDTDAPTTHNRTEFFRSNTQFGIKTTNSIGNPRATDYEMTIDVSGATQHEWRINNTTAAVIDSIGISANSSTTIITREKGDARYLTTNSASSGFVTLATDQTITGFKTFSKNVVIASALTITGESLVGIRSNLSVSGIGLFDFDILGATTSAIFRFNRATSTGKSTVIFFRGDGTTTEEARIDSGTGTVAGVNTTIITREKGDARYARLSAQNEFTTNQRISSTVPALDFNETDQVVDNKTWRLIVSDGAFKIQTVNDTSTLVSEAYTLIRTGNTVASHNFYVGGVNTATITNTGTSTPSTTTVITREKGDARYALTSGKITNDFNVNRLFVQNNGSAGAPAIRFTGASGTVGINVSANGKNLSFSVNGATSGIIDEPGTAAVNTVTVITREKGDARYTQISSDENLKENIIDAVSALPIIEQLRPVMYNFKADISARQHFGLIAQEVQAIMPNAVLQGGEGLGLELKDLVGLLIKGMQELKAENEALKTRVETLETV